MTELQHRYNPVRAAGTRYAYRTRRRRQTTDARSAKLGLVVTVVVALLAVL